MNSNRIFTVEFIASNPNTTFPADSSESEKIALRIKYKTQWQYIHILSTICGKHKIRATEKCRLITQDGVETTIPTSTTKELSLTAGVGMIITTEDNIPPWEEINKKM